MGEVQLTLNVMPEKMEGFEKLKQDIMSKMKNETEGLVKMCKIGEQDIAFGMKAVKVMIVVPDGEGVSKVEDKIKEIENVSSCDTVGVDRL
ncbi:MAG: elongation factor 1-beta [Candidatus Micrarchaeota archaeon]